MKHTVVLLASILLFIPGCGGGGSNVVQTATPSSSAVAVAISPTSATSLVNQATEFTASVSGTSNTDVTWSVQETNGGTVSAGVYTAPWQVGTYHVVATSAADHTKTATAIVAVSAKFAFVEALPNGQSTPFSVTPLIGAFGEDGSFATTNINNANTGTPWDAPMADVYLSGDGKKIVFDLLSAASDSSGGTIYSYNIGIANSDGTAVVQLTNNVPGDSKGDQWPQFSPDGQRIVYSHYDPTLPQDTAQIWTMNTDGSNRQLVWARNGVVAKTPSFSPDGKQIVFEYDGAADESHFYGIAKIGADGGSLQQFTGTGYDSACAAGWGELPTFTNRGTEIVYSKLCVFIIGGVGFPTETINTMAPNGTGIARLEGSGAGYDISCQPRAVADKLVFSTNADFSGTDKFELYSIMPDGSKLTRLTNNTVFDGLSIVWMWPPSFGTGTSSRQQRVQEQKLLHINTRTR